MRHFNRRCLVMVRDISGWVISARRLRSASCPLCLPKRTLARVLFRHTSRSDPPTVNLTERNEAPTTFVPQRNPHAPEALKQGKSADEAKFGMLAKPPRQTVTGDTAAQVVD